MKIKSLAAAALTAACFVTNNFVLNVSAHPTHTHTQSPDRKSYSTRNIYFDNFCVSLSLQIVNNAAVTGGSQGCNHAPDVVAGVFTTLNGVPRTMVVAGNFGILLGWDTSGRIVPMILAIFPDGTFKAYSGSVSAINFLGGGTWSGTPRRPVPGTKLLPFGAR